MTETRREFIEPTKQDYMPTITSSAIISNVRISEVFRMLGGTMPWHGRAKAFWRNGEHLSVSLRNDKAAWFDHAEGAGGGILDLITRVRGGTRRDALRWLADITGQQLDNRSPDRNVAAEWKTFNADLPDARLWRRAVLSILDETLVSLKSALFDPVQPRPDGDEILWLERLYSLLRGTDNRALVVEFRVWRGKWPATTQAMIRSAHKREMADKRALWRFIREMAE